MFCQNCNQPLADNATSCWHCGQHIDRTNVDYRAKYDFIGYTQEGLTLVAKNHSWGAINSSGQEVIPLRFEIIGPFENGMATAIFRKKEIWRESSKITSIQVQIDTLGRIKLQGIQDRIIWLSPKYDAWKILRHGYIEVGIDGHYGVIDYAGNEILPLRYDGCRCCTEDTFLVNLAGKSQKIKISNFSK